MQREVIIARVDEDQESVARQIGADHVLSVDDTNVVEAVKELTGGVGVPYSFEAIGLKKTAEQCFAMLRPGGVAVEGPSAKIQGVVHSAVGAANVLDGNNSEQIAPNPISPRRHSFNGVLVARNP